MSELEATKRIVEQRLYDLASELRFVPVRENTRPLHLRALALKRALREWSAVPPPPDALAAMHAELRALLDAARSARRDIRAA